MSDQIPEVSERKIELRFMNKYVVFKGVTCKYSLDIEYIQILTMLKKKEHE